MAGIDLSAFADDRTDEERALAEKLEEAYWQGHNDGYDAGYLDGLEDAGGED